MRSISAADYQGIVSLSSVVRLTAVVNGAASPADSNIRNLPRGLRSTTLLDAPCNKPRPGLWPAAFAPPLGGWCLACTRPHYGERGWRGGGIKDCVHKRSIFAADYRGIVYLSSVVRLTLRISGAAT